MQKLHNNLSGRLKQSTVREDLAPPYRVILKNKSCNTTVPSQSDGAVVYLFFNEKPTKKRIGSLLKRVSFGTGFWEILKEKAASGVEVRVIYDNIGCMTTLPGNYDKFLRDFGIDAVPFFKV